jgi:hypothetical protein
MFVAGGLLRNASAAPAPYVANPSTSWAVLVGVSNYDPPTHPTYGGDGDVAAFHRLLNAAGWPDSHILILTDQQATGNAIRQAIHWLVAHSAQNTFTLFHYSGHVYQGNGHEYLWGVDNNFISDAEFGQLMGPIGGRSWIDISGCESQGFDAGLSGPYRFFTGSSRVTEKSYEDPDWHESVWTGLAVDRGLLQRQSGALSIQSDVAWASEQATSMTANQQPHGPQHPYVVGGDTAWYLGGPFAPPAPAPAPSPSPPASTPANACAQLTLGLLRCGS